MWWLGCGLLRLPWCSGDKAKRGDSDLCWDEVGRRGGESSLRWGLEVAWVVVKGYSRLAEVDTVADSVPLIAWALS